MTVRYWLLCEPELGLTPVDHEDGDGVAGLHVERGQPARAAAHALAVLAPRHRDRAAFGAQRDRITARGDRTLESSTH
jgi:hypothetical protein